MNKHPSRKYISVYLHTHSKTPASFLGLVEFFLLLLLSLRCLVDFQTLGNTVSLLLDFFPALFLVRFLKISYSL